MKKRLEIGTLILLMAFTSMILVGCNGGGGEVVAVYEEGYESGYAPAVIENDSYDDIVIEFDDGSATYIPPGSAAEIDVGPDLVYILVFINGVFYEEILVGSGTYVVY